MKLNILSDLHLSAGPLDPPANDADVIVIAGDVARPERAIEWMRTLGKPVLFVAGNHEFYGGSIPGTIAQLKRLSAGTNVRVLAGDEVVCGGVRFLGTTLWTDFRLFADEATRRAAREQAVAFIRDFSRIRVDDEAGRVFTPEDSTALFDAQAHWLEERLAQPHAGATVVITHHAPSLLSIHPRFADSLFNACFVSAAERLLDGGRVRLWIHGHTHDSFDYFVNGTRVLCNPRGYAKDGVNENARFDANFVIDLAPERLDRQAHA
ncbi:MAG: metallophosphoesterase [Burkholderiales bacterium]|nr:metallophosphoesterase [Burkholderiales bacterium]